MSRVPRGTNHCGIVVGTVRDYMQRPMKMETAILIGSGIIAIAVALTQHWEIASAGQLVYRLDRWTGSVTVCAPTMKVACVKPPS